jgi:hypothetical protein
VGNLNDMSSKWILTTLPPDSPDFPPEKLIVVTKADNRSEIMFVVLYNVNKFKIMVTYY